MGIIVSSRASRTMKFLVFFLCLVTISLGYTTTTTTNNIKNNKDDVQSKHFGFGFPAIGAGYGYGYQYNHPSYGFNAYQGYHGGYNPGHYYGGYGYVPQGPVSGGGYQPYYRNNNNKE